MVATFSWINATKKRENISTILHTMLAWDVHWFWLLFAKSLLLYGLGCSPAFRNFIP